MSGQLLQAQDRSYQAEEELETPGLTSVGNSFLIETLQDGLTS